MIKKIFLIPVFSVLLFLAVSGSSDAASLPFGQEDAAIASSSPEDSAQAQTQPQDPKKQRDVLIKSGKFYYSQKKYDAALRDWEEALALDPQNKKIQAFIKKARAIVDKQAIAEKKKLEKARAAEEKKIKKAAATEQKKLEKERKKLENAAKKKSKLVSVMALSKDMVNAMSVDDCAKIAIKNHLPLQISEKNIKLAQMRLWEARRNMLPSVSIRYEESSGRVDSRAYTGRKQYVEGQQAIFHGGELFFTMKQAEVNLEVAKKDYDKIKNELILQVKKAYYTLAKAKENTKLQKELFGEVDRTYNMVNKGFEAGVIAKVEMLNVSSQQSQSRFQLASAEGDEAVADLILKQTMYMEPKEAIEIQPLPEFKKIEVDYEKVLRAAFLSRPEMKINSLMMEYYDHEKSIAKSKGWPKIDLMGNWGLAKEEYVPEDRLQVIPAGSSERDPDRKLEQQWYAGFKASMPFWGNTAEFSHTREQWVPVVSAYQGTEAETNAWKFNILDNLKYYSDKQSAEVDYYRARQEWEKIKQDITLEVRENCYNYAKALIQLETAASKVMYQEKDLEVNQLKRGMDEIPDSNVIESMIKLAQERFGLVQAVTDCYISVASINKAIGREFFKQEDSAGSDIEKNKM